VKIEAKLKAMGYELPPPFTFPKNNRTGCTQSGHLLFLSGHGLALPQLPGVRQTGKFGVPRGIAVEINGEFELAPLVPPPASNY
jgi:hypothetical protein